MAGRVQKVAGELKKIISQIIHEELKDPRIAFTTVTGVDVTADLQHATVFFTVLGDEEAKQKTLQAFVHSAGYIRKLVGKILKTKFTPQIAFKFDESFDSDQQIEKILDKIYKEQKNEPK